MSQEIFSEKDDEALRFENEFLQIRVGVADHAEGKYRERPIDQIV